MTEEEFSKLFDDEELDLLDQLGHSLRAQPVLELPPDFAAETARNIEARFENLSNLTKLAVGMETVLEAPMTSPRSLPWTLGLLAELISESPLYSDFGYKNHQQFGPDGHDELDRK